MSWATENCLQENNSNLSTTSAERNAATTLFRDLSPEDLKNSVLPTHELNFPIEELIATGEATFEFIRNSEMQVETKNAFHQLEKQFSFYRNLCLLKD